MLNKQIACAQYKINENKLQLLLIWRKRKKFTFCKMLPFTAKIRSIIFT